MAVIEELLANYDLLLQIMNLESRELRSASLSTPFEQVVQVAATSSKQIGMFVERGGSHALFLRMIKGELMHRVFGRHLVART